MNINPLVLSALSGLTFGGKIVSITPLAYTGTDTVYITFYTYLDQDESFADDEPQTGGTYGTVDIFCKGNYKSLLADAKTRLKSAGFTIQSIGPEQYEKDTELNHIPINIYHEREA